MTKDKAVSKPITSVPSIPLQQVADSRGGFSETFIKVWKALWRAAMSEGKGR